MTGRNISRLPPYLGAWLPLEAIPRETETAGRRFKRQSSKTDMFEVPPGGGSFKIIGYQQMAEPKVVLPRGVATYHAFIPSSSPTHPLQCPVSDKKAMQAPADKLVSTAAMNDGRPLYPESRPVCGWFLMRGHAEALV